MKTLTLCTLTLLASIINAYNFDDTVYNQILAEDLTELQWDDRFYHPRSKRDEEMVIKEDKCRRKSFRSCCDEDYFSSLREEEKPLRRDCYRQLTGREMAETLFDPFRCEKDKHKKDIACVAQCVGQKKGLVDEEGNVNEVTARKKIQDKMSKVEWLASKSEDIFTKCNKLAKEAASKQREKNHCNPAAAKLGHCIWREIQLACPDNRIIDDRKCNKIREDIKRNQNQAVEDDRK